MFDLYSMEVLIPSLFMIILMTVGMIWGYFKVRDLMKDDGDGYYLSSNDEEK